MKILIEILRKKKDSKASFQLQYEEQLYVLQKKKKNFPLVLFSKMNTFLKNTELTSDLTKVLKTGTIKLERLKQNTIFFS